MSVKQFNKVKGDGGEAIACDFLEKNGYQIVKRNWRGKGGEIDIIAKKNDVLHFVEVKMRENDDYGTGRFAVGLRKQANIRRLASLFLIEQGLYDQVFCCFDVLEINGTFDSYTVEHLENCF